MKQPKLLELAPFVIVPAGYNVEQQPQMPF